MSIKSISSAFHLSRNTVRKYVRRYQESGLTLDQLMTMSEEKLQELFLDNQNRSRKPSPRMDELEALIPDYVKRRDPQTACTIANGAFCAKVAHLGNIAARTRESLVYDDQKKTFHSKAADRLITPTYRKPWKF